MKLTRKEIESLLDRWNAAWDNHDPDGVMEFSHGFSILAQQVREYGLL